MLPGHEPLDSAQLIHPNQRWIDETFQEGYGGCRLQPLNEQYEKADPKKD